MRFGAQKMAPRIPGMKFCIPKMAPGVQEMIPGAQKMTPGEMSSDASISSPHAAPGKNSLTKNL
jgi:hypothetical protein